MSGKTENGNNLNVVLGATGALGSAVVYELAKKSKPVVAVSRSSEKAKKLFRNLNVIIREADIMKENEVLGAIEGAEIVYHCIGNHTSTPWAFAAQNILEPFI